jgi:nucleoside-diphosphate-sugar epimerase
MQVIMNNRKILVTGGAGFIGSHLVDGLLDLGHDVTIIDDFSSGRRTNLEHHENNPNLKIINISICDKDISSFFKDVSVVFHVAALPRVQFSIDFPEKTNEANITGTLNVLEHAKKNGVKRFIYSSSSSVYGDQVKLPLVESMKPDPMSPYGLQKLTGEYYCKLYYLLYGIETISLRYFNVYGPRQVASGGYSNLIPKTIGLSYKGKSPEIYGDGLQTRDFTYVKDIVEANILAAKTHNKEAFGEVFNVGNNSNLSVNEVVGIILGDKKISPIYKEPVVEPKNTLADNSKIKRILNWQPKFSFEEGIRESIIWYEQNH